MSKTFCKLLEYRQYCKRKYSRGQKFKTTTYKISIFQQSRPIIPTDAINRVFLLFLATKPFLILFSGKSFIVMHVNDTTFNILCVHLYYL